MTQPSREQYRRGQRVWVEAVVVDYSWGEPYGAVLVELPAATDEAHLLDGVRLWQPQALVVVDGVDIPCVEWGEVNTSEYKAEEGYYAEDE